MRVCIVGTGYIGLPTALMLATHGNEVLSVTHRQETADKLNSGKVPFKEEGLNELFSEAVEKKTITFTSEYPHEDLYIITVPTPYLADCKRVDPSHIIDAVRSVLAVANDNAIIVVESTISPGTIDKYIRPIVDESGKRVRLAHAPERIIPGNMVKELVNNSRTIGCDDQDTGETIRTLYKTFCKGDIEVTDIKTAEMTKVVENTFRDINIAFANELAKICRVGGLDVNEIIRISNKHPRVNILQPGPGVGGHCISIDPWFLVGDFPEEARIIRTAREINSAMPEFVLERIQSIMAENGINDLSQVGLYGLTYKENVDDTRESPTLQLLEVIKKAGFPHPAVYDPMVSANVVERQYESFEQFVEASKLIVILVSHDHLKENMSVLKNKVVFDTRSICPLPNVYRL